MSVNFKCAYALSLTTINITLKISHVDKWGAAYLDLAVIFVLADF